MYFVLAGIVESDDVNVINGELNKAYNYSQNVSEIYSFENGLENIEGVLFILYLVNARAVLLSLLFAMKENISFILCAF